MTNCIGRLRALCIMLCFVVAGHDCMNSQSSFPKTNQPTNILDYSGTPVSPTDRSSLAFSDQGAWFAYGFPDDSVFFGGFSGPFLMTQENGVWCSPSLSQLTLWDSGKESPISLEHASAITYGYLSHLTQIYETPELTITQTLFYASPHSAIITTEIENRSDRDITIQPGWTGAFYLPGLELKKIGDAIGIHSDKSNATGYIDVIGDSRAEIELSNDAYRIKLTEFQLRPGEGEKLMLAHSFIFPEYDSEEIRGLNNELEFNINGLLKSRIIEKETQLQNLNGNLKFPWTGGIYENLVAKAILTLQNNWRIAAGELRHSGLFLSYHYIWFNGFWAWDSWKHAVALAYYNTDLAKDQIRAMFDFQDASGFIADCAYRDTSIENHNYRNSKPPLSAWAVWNVYQQDSDLQFLKEIYPLLLKQHRWWYRYRDHDKDGICEYGSTDGSLIAAKWESGMDNAVRFDNSAIVMNTEIAFSLDQESVDLNAYLYAEKMNLVQIASRLGKKNDARKLEEESIVLKRNIQNQFFDPVSGWFYDTSLDGKTFVNIMGCEGWIPLWAKVATGAQAEAVKDIMMDSQYFYTKVPFQTLSAKHPGFKPDGGYWRGPTWIDQAYFGVVGLKNYGYEEEAKQAIYKLVNNAAGVLDNGSSIRENYNPETGEGLESQNFSWSAAHYLLLLIDGK